MRAISLARVVAQALSSRRGAARGGSSAAAAVSDGGGRRRSLWRTISSPAGTSSSPGSTSYRMYPWPGSTLVRICGASSAPGACCAPAAIAARAQIAGHTTAIPHLRAESGPMPHTAQEPLVARRAGGARTVRFQTFPGPLGGSAAVRKRPSDRRQQLLRQARLLQRRGGAGLHRGALIVDAEAGGQRQDGKRRESRIGPQLAQQGEAVQLRQRDVEHHRVE